MTTPHAAPRAELEAQYRKAAAIVAELDPLVAAFVERVKDAAMWPLTERGDEHTPVPDTLRTAGHERGGRNLCVYHDGTWLVHDHVAGSAEAPEMVVKSAPGQSPQFIEPILGEPGPADVQRVMENPLFGRYMDAVDHAREWVPAEMAGYLAGHGIPAPPSLTRAESRHESGPGGPARPQP
ncbi:hypothetical protein [Sinomonas soli]